jgi:hypothetical protein
MEIESFELVKSGARYAHCTLMAHDFRSADAAAGRGCGYV